MSERDIFLAALDLPDADRPHFLTEQCGADAGLRKRVDALFQAHAAAGDFLADPLSPGGTTATFNPGTHTHSPDRSGPVGEIGQVIAERYKLIERIGEGGMGSVWMAEQTEPVKRKVAVKLIKPGLDSKTVLARFEAERQALALMEHENIAKVYDGGVDEGRPYFVMELVKGVPITQFCDERKLTPAQRLELFIPVCQAIQHAHQKGVIHRDVKPANVLVALYDERPVPKVIDFGVAKATGPTLTEHTLNTGFGAVVGTPQYMSPEQATFNNLDIDTRSDVYSLGVLLYELLAGSPPFQQQELERRGLLEMLRVVREEEPPRPSTKLSTANALPSLAANRGTEPKKLTGLLRNELDWIVMKALEKDRTRRYETANGFAADVLRYLSGEPVTAHPPTAGYRLKKFVRKNKGPVVAGSLVFLALSLGIAGTTVGLIRAEEKRAEADQAREREAEQRATAVAEKKRAIEFRDKALDALRATTSEDVEKLLGEKRELTANEKTYLEAIAVRWRTFAEQAGVDEQSRAIRAEGHFRVGTLWHRLDRRERAQPEYERAIALREQLAADFPVVPAYRQGLGQGHTSLGLLLASLGKEAAAEVQYAKALAIKQKLVADFPTVPEYRDELALSHNNLGVLLSEIGSGVEALKQLAKALAIRQRLATDFPTVTDYRWQLALSHNNLGFLLRKYGLLAEAEEEHRRGLVIQEKLAADAPASPAHRRELAMNHSNLGLVLEELGRRAEGEGQQREAVAIKEALVAEFPAIPAYRIDLAGSYCNFGKMVRDHGDTAGSLSWFDKAVATARPAHEAEPRDVTASRFLRNCHWGRAEAYDRLRKFAEAAPDWDKAVELSAREEQPRFRALRASSRVNTGKAAEAVAEVAELQKMSGWTAGQLYGFACVYAVASTKIADKKQIYSDRAMELLQKAVEAEYKDATHMKADRDLDPLRGRDDFKKLLADLEAKFPPKKEVLPPPRKE